MPPRQVLAIDQGSTNSKAVLFDEGGRVVSAGSRPLPTEFPQPGWVQQDPLEIWSSVVEAVRDCLSNVSPADVTAIGITNQRESAIAWDRRTGAPLGPCITWQCRRTSTICDDLRSAGHGPLIAQMTGLGIDPLFSASKMRWLLNAIPDGQRRAENGEICLGTVDAWLLWKLTDGSVHATDSSNASRTQLLNLATAAWDPALLELFAIPLAALPEVRPSTAFFGEAQARDFPCRAPITGVAGDSHAAMFGHGAFGPGTVKATYGTGSSLMTLAADVSNGPAAGLSGTIAWQLQDGVTRALEGNIASTGATLEWIGRLVGFDEHPGRAAANLAMTSDSGGVYIVPAFVGLGAPHWDDQARGLICGLTRGSTAMQLARAGLESIAYQVADVFDAMEDASGSHLAELRADGGASSNGALMQFQADILGRPVVRDTSLDLSAFGAACLAGLGCGIWELDAVRALPRKLDRFEPSIGAPEARALRAGWQMAIDRTKLRASTERQDL